MNGEIDEFLVKQVSAASSTFLTSFSGFILIFTNGLVAFLLNYSSFVTNKEAGALTMAVLGNMKQLLSIAASLVVFPDGYQGFVHIFGVVLALGGGLLYSLVEVCMAGHVEMVGNIISKDDMMENEKDGISAV